MPMKWTATNVQMLLWLAWGNCKYEAKDILDAWPNIPGEEAPTKIAIQHKISDIRKGVRNHGVASFFTGSMSTPRQSRGPKNGQSQQPAPVIIGNGIDSKSGTANANGLHYETEHHPTATQEQVTSTASIKPEDHSGSTSFGTDATATTYLDLDTTVLDRGDLNGREQSVRPNGGPDTGDGSHDNNMQYLSPPTKKPGRGLSGTAAKSNTRKRRRGDDSDSASMTTGTTQSEFSITAPEFDMKLRPDHRGLNLHESNGEMFDTGSDGSDAAWVPGVEEGRGRRKRVRRH